MKPKNYNKRWNYSKWVQWYREQNPTSKAFRKRRGTKTGKHK